MKKKIALLGCSHETNTFSPVGTCYDDFANGNFWRGQEVREAFYDSHAVMAGFFRAAEEHHFEPVPLLFTRAEPLGEIAQDAAEKIVSEMLEALKHQGPWDGVLLALHGAAVAESEPDFDGWIVSAVRKLIGPHIPVGVVFDLHANVTQRMIDDCDVAVFYRTNPHLDTLERGRECGRLLAQTVHGDIKPTQALVRLPMIIGITRSDTSEAPMRTLLAGMEEQIKFPGVLSASLTEGFPWADVAEMGMAVLVVTNDDIALAETLAKDLARKVWDRRHEMIDEILSPENAVQLACEAKNFPVGILDVGDNIGAGGPGDSTVLLDLALKNRIKGVLLTIFDPEAVQCCIQSGLDTTLSVAVGAKLDVSYCRVLHVRGRVRCVSDGRFEDTVATHEGYRYFNTGPTVVLELENDVTVVLTSRRVGNVSQMQFRALDIDLESKRIIILKGVNAPRGAFKNVCSSLIMANTRGATSVDYSSFAYKNRSPALFPFEADVEF